jgi:hypothetical protein
MGQLGVRISLVACLTVALIGWGAVPPGHPASRPAGPGTVRIDGLCLNEAGQYTCTGANQ